MASLDMLRPASIVLAAAVVAVVVSTVAATALAMAPVDEQVDFKNPVKSMQDDLVSALPGLTYTPNFKHYSGYLNADSANNRFWHYWFVESQSRPDTDPLVLWLNGGPGCSSLLGLLTELGPFRVGPNNTVVANEFAWNKRANVIFLESPASVGFSYAANGDVSADDDTTAQQNHRALKSFMAKFPQYKNRPLYLTGESYGGVYLPTLAVLVDADPELNLKGVAIGNGYLDANKLGESLVYFSYYHGLVGRSTWDGLSQFCCNGKPPARHNCNFSAAGLSNDCVKYIEAATNEILASGINPYNLYDQCYYSDSNSTVSSSSSVVAAVQRDTTVHRARAPGREYFDKLLVKAALKFNKRTQTNTLKRGANQYSAGLRWSQRGQHPNTLEPQYQDEPALANDPPCTDDSVTINYLNQPQVRQALHIPNDLKTPFTTCSTAIKYTMIYPARQGGLAPQIKQLINSPRKLTLLVYNGDVDCMCNFIGDEWFVDDLGQTVESDYAAWYTDSQVSGFAKYYDGITYMTVKGSGHMVPTDRPAEALHMFTMFLDGMRPTIAPL